MHVIWEKTMQTVIEKRIELLKVQNARLRDLLDNPQPGLTTWLQAVPQVVAEINAIMAGERD